MPSPPPDTGTIAVGLGKGRLESLSDGVFGVALTLLALVLIVPNALTGRSVIRWSDVAGLLPALFVVLLGFVIVGSFWLGNHLVFHFVSVTDRYFIWLNLLFLFTIVILPYSTLLVADYPTQQPTIVFFGINQLMAGVLSASIWWYAGRMSLVRPGTDRHTRTLLLRRLLVGPVLTAVGIAVAILVSPTAGLVVYVSIIVLYFIPSHIDEHLRAPDHASRRGPGL